MKNVILYIASTIDGYIARKDGSLDWLEKYPDPGNDSYGYNKFIASVDTVIMGRNTYEEILGFGVDWPYRQMRSIVATSDENYKISTPSTSIINKIDAKVIDEIKLLSDGEIWICGGGRLITDFLRQRYLDEMILFIIPVVLGSGIRLFYDDSVESWFDLIESVPYSNGVIKLRYRKKKNQI